MSIEFRCNACNKLLRVPEGSAGKKAQCPGCQAVLQIPAASPPLSPTPTPPSSSQSSSFPPLPPKSVTPPDSSPGLATPLPSDGSSSPFATPGQTPPQLPPVSDNPFASPSAASGPVTMGVGVSGSIVPTKIDFSLLEKTWKVFSSDTMSFILMALIFIGCIFGGFIAFYFIFILLIVGFGAVIGGQNAGAGIVGMFLFMGLFYIAFILGACWIYLGVIKFCLGIIRGNPANFGDLFSGGRFLLRAIGLGFLQIVAIYGIMIPCVVPGIVLQNEFAMLGGQFIGMFLMIPIALLLLPAMSLVVDKDLGVFQAIRTSFQIMKGNLLITFALLLTVGFLGSIVSVFTCGIGYLAYLPFLHLTVVMIYMAASGQLDQSDSAPNAPIA